MDRDRSHEPRRKGVFDLHDVAGATRTGSSSAQSLARGAGSIESDFLNGEIALLGRLHGVPVPLNAGLARLGHRLIAERLEPGSLDLAAITAELG